MSSKHAKIRFVSEPFEQPSAALLLGKFTSAAVARQKRPPKRAGFAVLCAKPMTPTFWPVAWFVMARPTTPALIDPPPALPKRPALKFPAPAPSPVEEP